MRRTLGMLAATGLALASSGCAILPAAGPTVSEVEHGANGDVAANFVVLDVDEAVVSALAKAGREGFGAGFSSKAGAADLRIAVGDVLQITLIEVGGGIFGQASSSTTLGAQSFAAQTTPFQPATVGHDGMVNVPFAGRIAAAGKTTDEVRQSVESGLSAKSSSPQVEVQIVSGTGNVATVAGDVNHPGVLPVAPGGSRLIDMIAAAEGSKFPSYETTVRITRNGRATSASLQNIVERPEENVYIHPKDSVYLSHEPRTFSAFGATEKVGFYPFETARLSLAEAIAKVGGFVDKTADPAGAFLFRHEPESFVLALRPDLAGKLPESVPVVFRMNLRESPGYFLAQRFQMRDKDVILIADAEGTQLMKFFALLKGASTVVNDLKKNASGGGSSSSGF